MTITLPWPPSVNTYWRVFNGRAILSAKGREYRTAVLGAVLAMPRRPRCDGRIRVSITAHAPDNRRRDIDNLLKGVLDGLEHAEVYGDDWQVDKLTIERGAIDRGNPRVVIEVCEL